MTAYAIAKEVPESSAPYLTADKIYAVEDHRYGLFILVNDLGQSTICSWNKCAHLGFEDWTPVAEYQKAEVEARLAAGLTESEYSIGRMVRADTLYSIVWQS